MIRKVYEVQRSDSTQGDFVELISKDKDSLSLNLSDREISVLTKSKFKKIIKSKTKQAAFKYLQKIKEGHSKMDGLTYTQFEKSE